MSIIKRTFRVFSTGSTVSQSSSDQLQLGLVDTVYSFSNIVVSL